MKGSRLFLLAGSVALTLVAGACGGEEPAIEAEPTVEAGIEGAIQVELGEFFVRPSEESAAAGEVTFESNNTGSQIHELVVIRTELKPGNLPLSAGGVLLADPDLDLVDIVSRIFPGASAPLTVDLKAGSYVLICNIPGHYSSGMRAAFSVS